MNKFCRAKLLPEILTCTENEGVAIAAVPVDLGPNQVPRIPFQRPKEQLLNAFRLHMLDSDKKFPYNLSRMVWNNNIRRVEMVVEVTLN